MPTPTAKDPGLDHWIGIAGYRLQMGMKAAAYDFSRAMLDSPNLGHQTTRQTHGAYTYKGTLSGDSSHNVAAGLQALMLLDSQVYLDVGKNAGDAAIIARVNTSQQGETIPFGSMVTWSLPFQTDAHEHAAVNVVGTLANHWKPGASALTATGTTTAVQMTRAVAADEEIIFAVMEADYPAPSAGSTLVGKLQSATDEVFTTPVDRITLSSIGATFGAQSDVLAGAFSANLWWRISWTVTGTTPTRYPIAAFGWRLSNNYLIP